MGPPDEDHLFMVGYLAFLPGGSHRNLTASPPGGQDGSRPSIPSLPACSSHFLLDCRGSSPGMRACLPPFLRCQPCLLGGSGARVGDGVSCHGGDAQVDWETRTRTASGELRLGLCWPCGVPPPPPPPPPLLRVLRV